MNREQIIQMAREAGFYQEQPMYYDESMLEAFAKLVAEHERFECAELCEMLDIKNPQGKSWDEGTIDCSNAIRARGQA